MGTQCASLRVNWVRFCSFFTSRVVLWVVWYVEGGGGGLLCSFSRCGGGGVGTQVVFFQLFVHAGREGYLSLPRMFFVVRRWVWEL